VRSVGVAYLLWFPWGILGIHRFYLGRVGTGLIWLFTGGLCAIGWIVDLFLIPGLVREANARIMSDLQEMAPAGFGLGRDAPGEAMAAPRGGDITPPSAPADTGFGNRVIYCTRCGGPMQVPLEAVGRQYGCPNCRAVLVVPA
jgi:TM2 domain-containing membrane protein YozV